MLTFLTLDASSASERDMNCAFIFSQLSLANVIAVADITYYSKSLKE